MKIQKNILLTKNDEKNILLTQTDEKNILLTKTGEKNIFSRGHCLFDMIWILKKYFDAKNVKINILTRKI